MSLSIQIEAVTHVLLPDGKWYTVDEGSFELDAYEFLDGDPNEVGAVVFGGGQDARISATGATWTDGDKRISCPLSTVLAVRTRLVKL